MTLCNCGHEESLHAKVGRKECWGSDVENKNLVDCPCQQYTPKEDRPTDECECGHEGTCHGAMGVSFNTGMTCCAKCICNGYKVKTTPTKEDVNWDIKKLAEIAAMQATNIIFNRQPGWSAELQEEMEAILSKAQEQARQQEREDILEIIKIWSLENHIDWYRSTIDIESELLSLIQKRK